MNILRIFYYFDLYRDGIIDVIRIIYFGLFLNYEKVFIFFNLLNLLVINMQFCVECYYVCIIMLYVFFLWFQECYIRVLKGYIVLVFIIFFNEIKGNIFVF